jgi:tetrahydromethanopterin S-methyltransferase subunit H
VSGTTESIHQFAEVFALCKDNPLFFESPAKQVRICGSTHGFDGVNNIVVISAQTLYQACITALIC